MMTCPGCSSTDVRTSQSTRWSDIFQRVHGRDVFRCRSCRLRFFASTPTGDGAKLLGHRRKQRLRRRLIVVAIFVAAFMIFWFFLRYLTAEKDTPSESGADRFPVTYSLS
jgi:hypothetical protein